MNEGETANTEWTPERIEFEGYRLGNAAHGLLTRPRFVWRFCAFVAYWGTMGYGVREAWRLSGEWLAIVDIAVQGLTR